MIYLTCMYKNHKKCIFSKKYAKLDCYFFNMIFFMCVTHKTCIALSQRFVL